MAGFIKEIIRDILKPARPMTEEERRLARIENTQREIRTLNAKNYKLESDIRGIKFAKKIMLSVIGFGGIVNVFTNFSLIIFLGLMIGYGIIAEVFKFAENDAKAKIEFNKKSIEYLSGNMDAFGAAPNHENISRNMTDEELKKGPVIDADIITETSEETSTPSDKYLNSIPEAKEAFDRVDELEDIVFSLGSFDNDLYSLFKPAVESATRTVELIQQDKNRETKAYKFYNYVEILYKWANDLEGLYKKGVYSSLLINVKEQAKKALPNLQRKINDEYYKLINPTIMDLESEMEMMSNEL